MIKKYSLVFIAFLCFSLSGYGQTYTQITTIGDLTDGNYLIVGDGSSNDGLMKNTTSGSVLIDYTPITNPGATITTGYTAANVFEITVSGGNITIYNANEGYASWGRSGATGSDADFYSGTVANTERWTPTVNGAGLWTLKNVSNSSRILQWNNSAPRFVAYDSNQVKLKLYKLDGPAGPTITAAPTTITGLDYFYNIPPSYEDTFTVEGTDLTNNIVITAPTDFEISLTSGSGFTNTITLNESSGSVASTTIYVRLISGKAIGTYTDDIDITSTGASTKTVSVSGDVVDIYCEPTWTNTGDSEIESVSLAGESSSIANTSSSCTNTVQFNLSESADLIQGQSYVLTVGFGDCDGGSYYDGAGGVWIDWNNDGDFDDLDEEIGVVTISTSAADAVQTENFTINVNAAQAIGDFRMRILQEEGETAGLINACDSNNDMSYGGVEDYTIEVISSCTPTHTFTSMLPTSGPEDTEITVTGSGFTAGTTASFGAVAATVDFIDATTLIIYVPAGAATGTIKLTEAGCRLQTEAFTVLEGTGSCAGTLSDLIISQISDPNSGNEHYIEIYNGTGASIDLDALTSDYEIQTYYNGNISGALGSGTPNTSSNFDFYIDLTGTIPNNTAWVISAGELGSLATYPAGDIIPFGFNENEVIYLYKNSNPLDIVGVANDNDWMNQVGISYSRNTDTTGPTTSFNETGDWTYSTSTSGIKAGLGSYIPDIAPKPAPNISAITDASDCSVLDYSVTASEGDTVTPGDLTYQWYFNNGVNDVWTPVTSTLPSGYTILGEDGDNLLMEGDTNSLNDLANYQFYCEVTEAGSCTNVSNAIQPNYNVVTWNGSWSSFPGTNSTVVLNANYDTASGGDQISFSACSLIINNVLLSIGDGDFVEVTNDVTVNGTNGAIEIEPQGSFVQINDSGVVAATIPTNLKVSKLTAPSNNWYEYTYWSSPVFQETPANGLALSNPNRRYQYNAEYYRDSTFETANDGTATVGAGVDDIDDNGNDWGNISTTYLTPGLGYASTHNPTVFSSTPGCPGPTCRIRYTFSGLFNNGVITVPLYRNDEELGDNNWNFVGNPYPSAISADVFLATNMALIDEEILEPNPIIGGAIYLWSQNTAPSNTANGNNGLNFSDTDYAIINGTGQTAAQENGGDSTIPNRFIPSGQGFFISMDNNATSTTVSPSPVPTQDIQTANLIFNNAMRVTGDNNQFFRPSNDTNSINKLWLNLTSDNGVFSQILVGYLDHATDAYDGMYFDAPKNGVTSSHSAIYTLIPNSDKKLAIQGKNSNSLTLDEVIPLGFYTSIDVATLYTFSISQFEGAFMTDNAVYINDKLLNTFHNLKNSDYTFTSETGEFNDRFEIVFTPTILLSIDDNLINSNEVTLTELQNGDVEIKVGHTHTIKHVDIIDITGRRIYSLQGDDSTEVYNLSKLSQAAYVAKITLSNGQVISKKAIKQK